MKKQRKFKRIFLYDEETPTVENYKHAYKHIKAISDDSQHYFEFVVNQDDYKQSLKELCNKFENFCVNECGFDDCACCEVWTTFYPHSKFVHIDGYRGELYTETLYSLLCSCDWATICHMETQYYYNCSHLRLSDSIYDRPPTFEEFVSANGYNKLKEPYATKELFDIFHSTVSKKQFTNEELQLILSFIIDKIYLTGYKQWISFTANLSDFLLERTNIDLFDDCHSQQKQITSNYIRNNLHTLDVAIIRLLDNDKKSLKALLKDFDPQYKRYVKTIIKNRKFYDY